ncbi:LysR family transcriptional regulator [Pseudomonas kairouanensis]|uniref:LysR family transcriptional regulator n=1 Tax=Pseudomonas kairouanensis TaxID=2293832 RepID=A0A4Z0AYQ0_9PSED|nr:LysR family transcriptional regulator [Pseudomonas kairouanensis]TFY91319.1 LysR family transcriptional regulator [Pseudomonas kairouanensis]
MPDLNLLITLDALLAEGSVARAAQRLGLSPSAMSRALARLRETTGDPLLVRAGRGLVPTPRAMELREQVGRLVQDAHVVLRPAHALDMARVERTFTLRASEEFVEHIGPALLARIAQDAPGVRLRFVNKTDKDSALLRHARVDLDTGVVDADASPELLTQALFRDRLVGVVRSGHPLSTGEIVAERYAAGQHVYVSRHGRDSGQIDDALQSQGLTRQISTIVTGFFSAIALARHTDLIASVPERYIAHQREGLHSFELPLSLPAFTVAMLWHPRLDADLAHRWLRGCLREVCAPQQVQSPLP